jgi:hypothetical protein
MGGGLFSRERSWNEDVRVTLTLDQLKELGREAWWDEIPHDYAGYCFDPLREGGPFFQVIFLKPMEWSPLPGLGGDIAWPTNYEPPKPGEVLPLGGWKHTPRCDCEWCKGQQQDPS